MTTQTVLPVAAAVDRPAARPSWPPLLRAGFRIAFLYFACFVLIGPNGGLFALMGFLMPMVTWKIYMVLLWLPDQATLWAGQHLFHLTGLAARWHPTGSGDTALSWVEEGLYAVFAIAGGLVWTLVAALRGNRRAEYTTLHAWLLFLLRFTCAYFMLIYGYSKIFPAQMAPISIGILNEPVGNMSPMTMLWALIGLHPLYEMVCGLAEVVGGVLLLFRRTALLGALISALVMTNVLLYNLFFDVPVKLFAANLLLACLYLALPDLRALFAFFWLHRPAVAKAAGIPPTSRRWSRVTLRVAEIAVMVALLLVVPWNGAKGWRKGAAARHAESPLVGAWHVEDGHAASGAFLTGEGAGTADFYIDTINRAFRRSIDGQLWRTGLDVQADKHLITVYASDTPPWGASTKYSWQMLDANHLVLTTVPPNAPNTKGKSPATPVTPFRPETISFTRLPTMTHYPLLERGFHFVNEWGYER